MKMSMNTEKITKLGISDDNNCDADVDVFEDSEGLLLAIFDKYWTKSLKQDKQWENARNWA